MVKVNIYARESVSDTTKAPPIQNQIDIGKEWTLKNNFDLLELLVDDGYSGGDWNRPGWNKAMRDARGKRYNILWVWNQDRIARDTEQFLKFCRELKSGGVRIFVHTDNEYMDMDSLGGKLKNQSLAQAAEIYRLVTSEKVRAAYQRKKQKGEAWGRERRDVDVKRIIDMRGEGKSWRVIGKALSCSHTMAKNKYMKEIKSSG